MTTVTEQALQKLR